MKKIFKYILFSLIFALICPVVFFACGEVSFDSVPYTDSGANLEEVIQEFNATGEYMVKNLKLKSQYETTNTYTFYNTQTSSAKVVKDVIVTTLGSLSDNPTLTIIEKTRYVNNKKVSRETNTYVQPNTSVSETPYCYSLTSVFDDDAEIQYKERNEYNPNNEQSIINFYNSIIYEIKKEEVCNIQQKVFEGVTYYKLNSGVDTLEFVNDRFIEETEDNTLYDNPQLFKKATISNLDSAENFYYECAKNGSNYASYFKIHYNIKNNERETYLNVLSLTKLLKFGESVTPKMPEDVNEYISNSFVKSMQKSGSYISYTTTEEIADDEFSSTESGNRVVWTVARVGNDYSVRRDEYQEGVQSAITSLFYLVYVSENNYTAYSINGQKRTRVDIDIEITNFNFNQNIFSRNDDENSYQYGNEEFPITVKFKDNNIYSVSTYTERNDAINLYVKEYGNDFTKLPLFFVTNINDYELVV